MGKLVKHLLGQGGDTFFECIRNRQQSQESKKKKMRI